MKKGVTLKDIAQRLNMSVSTVSKALKGDTSISKMTSDRVKKLSTEWNYIPNEAARHFKLNKTQTLGLIIPDLLDQFFVLAINGVEEIAAQNQYNVIVSQSHEDAYHESSIVDIMIRNRVDGVIVAISKNTTDMLPFMKLIKMGMPVVFFSRSPRDPLFNYVSADNEQGVMKAMNFLLDRGHKRIAHIMGPPTLSVSYKRLEGYKKALQRHGFAFDESLVKVTDLTSECTCEAMKELMELSSPPTAVFTFKNYISLDIIQFLKLYHPDKLDEIDIVGFGNLPLLQYLDNKPSASLDEDSFEMGVQAAKLIFNIIDAQESGNPVEAEHIRVPCKLVIHR